MQTAMKIMAEKEYDSMIYNTPMKISDVSSLFRKPVSKNERPYEKEVITYNNDQVDKWYAEVLLKIADNQGSIPAGRVNSCFQYFIQGKELAQHQKYKDFLPEYSEEKIKFWIDLFTKSNVKDLCEMGHGVVSGGWNVIVTGIRYYFADKKWEKIYSKTTDPAEWDKMANNNGNLMNGRPLPYGLTLDSLSDIEEKVIALLKNPISPKE